MIGKAIKKPVEIEFIIFDGSSENLVELSKWTENSVDYISASYEDRTAPRLKIPTLEGDHFADVGDYIIKGIKGEFYPCKPDIFKLTYDILK